MAGIALVAALFITLFTVLWYRSWWQVPGTPNAQFIVQGEAEHEGMVVTVEGPELGGPLRATIRSEQNYVAFFALPAGSYSVRITSPDGRVYFNEPMFHLPEYHRLQVALKSIDEQRRKATSAPT